MLNGKTPKKISDLQGDDLDSFVTDLPLASLIEVDTEDSLMMALAYGNSKHYLVENGQVSMKQVEYTKNGNKWLGGKFIHSSSARCCAKQNINLFKSRLDTRCCYAFRQKG